MAGFGGAAGMGGKVIDGNVDSFPATERVEMAHEECRVQAIRVVIIAALPFFGREMAMIIVVAVVLKIGNIFWSYCCLDATTDGGLTTASASGNANDKWASARWV